jgi:hypothetical protein
MSFVFVQVFALQSALKLFFLLVVLTTSLEMLQICLLLSTCFFKEKVVGYLPNYFPLF